MMRDSHQIIDVLLWSSYIQEISASMLFAHMSGRHLWKKFPKSMHDHTFNTDSRAPLEWHKCAYFERLAFRNDCIDYDFVLHVYWNAQTCDKEFTTWLFWYAYAPRADMTTVTPNGGWYQNNHVLTSKYYICISRSPMKLYIRLRIRPTSCDLHV